MDRDTGFYKGGVGPPPLYLSDGSWRYPQQKCNNDANVQLACDMLLMSKFDVTARRLIKK